MNNVYPGLAATYDRINTCLGPVEEKMLMTGLHKVCDLFCVNCNTLLGWKYVR